MGDPGLSRDHFRLSIQANQKNWDAYFGFALWCFDENPDLAEQSCNRGISGLPIHVILAHIGLAILATRIQFSQKGQSEINIVLELLAVAEEQRTIPRSQLNALNITINLFENPDKALENAQCFDLEVSALEERDMLVIALKYLSILANQMQRHKDNYIS